MNTSSVAIDSQRHLLHASLALTCLLFLLGGCTTPHTPSNATASYDLALVGGRVIDPETGLDAVRNVAISNGRVALIADTPIAAKQTVDVSGLVVAPGFIDLHTHAWTDLGQQFQVRDGVTTALELESGAYPVNSYATFEPIAIAGKARINFGASVGHAWARWRLVEPDNPPASFGAVIASAVSAARPVSMDVPAFTQPLTDAQTGELDTLLNDGLDQGGLGIGVLLDYMSSAVSDAELQLIFDVAAKRAAPIFVHIRRGVAGDTAGLHEVINLAESTGAAIHICHLQASAMQNVQEFLTLIRSARKRGVKISTESFPYNAGSTSISAAVFSRNWQDIFAISYEDVEWAATGERFTEAMWREYREKYPGGSVIHHYNKEAWTRVATEAPDVIVAADGVPILSLDQKVAPFGVGTYARVLGRYTEERGGKLTLMQALAKMTILPARVLETYIPAMQRKGRVQVGADADITIFDSSSVIDNATFQDPYNASSGIRHVLVNGQFVVRDSQLQEDAFPGKRILKSF